MPFDFSDIFARYEAVVADADKVFAAVRDRFPDKVVCARGCSDCCNALFDLSLVEAMYLNHKFNALADEKVRDEVLARADEAERKQHRIVRKAMKAKEQGTATDEVLAELGRERIRCPLLGEDNSCALYAARPLTCRIYGVPMAFEGAAHTCGLSGFVPGEPYPTVQIEKLQDRLVELSAAIAERVDSKFSGIATLFVPASVALMNVYDDEYLGVKDPKQQVVEEFEPPVDESLFGPAPAASAEPLRQGPVDPNVFVPGRRLEFNMAPACGPKGCASCGPDGCNPDTCTTCGDQPKEGGCSGNPVILEFGGSSDE